MCELKRILNIYDTNYFQKKKIIYKMSAILIDITKAKPYLKLKNKNDKRKN